jgi:cytochrome c oxidase cbb3-type subunit 3
MKKKFHKKDNELNKKTTGHEWDGIREYDNPDPFWLRLVFYTMLFTALGYWLLYPSWPSPNNKGILGWSSSREVKEDILEIQKIRSKYQDKFDKLSFEEIMKDPKMLNFAVIGGRSAFQNNCAVCHGADGGGNIGYPNLASGAWIWGGSIDDIYTTLKHGIRSGDENARDSNMAAFGKDRILTEKQISDLVEYVLSLNTNKILTGESHDLFQSNCASCHGSHGEGGRSVGAPALNDAIWLYGQSKEQIYDVIFNGRAGVMPYWSGRLDDSTIRQLSIYVHQLGGGE